MRIRVYVSMLSSVLSAVYVDAIEDQKRNEDLLRHDLSSSLIKERTNDETSNESETVIVGGRCLCTFYFLLARNSPNQRYRSAVCRKFEINQVAKHRIFQSKEFPIVVECRVHTRINACCFIADYKLARFLPKL